MKNKPFFLKNVQLSGYKSIKNVEVDFENGLNIIIGKNAAGKTNFLSFLDVIIKKTQKIYFDYYSKLLFFGKDEYLIEKESKFQKENNLDANFFVNEIIIKNKKKIERTQLKLFYHSTLIKHGVPENYLFVDKPFSFELSDGEIDSNLVELVILKEQAEDKQIIISTHSPQVLNILGRDELNKIIIATSEGKKGTVLKHLNEEQKEKAKSYMDDEVLFLSDYWMYSDLEERV